MASISEDLRKIFLAGVGAVAVTAEKSMELVEELVKKGELTVEQGKVINEELKRDCKDKGTKLKDDVDATLLKLESFSKEELSKVRQKLTELENKLKEE